MGQKATFNVSKERHLWLSACTRLSGDGVPLLCDRHSKKAGRDRAYLCWVKISYRGTAHFDQIIDGIANSLS
jgi:hypothetical protein